MNKVLIIQTAFIGDVILATSLIKETKSMYPECEIHFLLRSGNQSLLKNHPDVKKIIVWNKKDNKTFGLIKLALQARAEKYDLVLNIQRFTSSGIFTLFCGAKRRVGFNKNPLSFFFSKSIKHEIPFYIENKRIHEVQRNSLLLHNGDHSQIMNPVRPNLYFSEQEVKKINKLVESSNKYIVLAPSSVWFTKQFQKSKWIELSQNLVKDYTLFFIGGPDDKDYIQSICPDNKNAINLCGKLSLTESALLMRDAQRVLVNDSAPLHLASSVNARTTAIFCSTVKDFGYFPLSDDSTVVEASENLSCKPCGLHGKKQCPLGHFKCSDDIDIKNIIKTI